MIGVEPRACPSSQPTASVVARTMPNLSAGALSAVLLMLGLPGDTWLRLGVWLLFGLVIYFFYGMRHSRVANET